MESRYVTIASFYMPHEVEIAVSLLEEKGIPTVIRDDNTNPMGGGHVEIRLQVPEQNADDALDILDGMENEGVDLLEDVEETFDAETKKEETPSHWKDIPEGHSNGGLSSLPQHQCAQTATWSVSSLAEPAPARTSRAFLSR